MKALISIQNRSYEVDFSKPIDLSIPLIPDAIGPNCFYAPFFDVSPVIAGDFKGSTVLGGPVNFLNVRLNPHGNGTHTECVGHIATEKYTINDCLKQFTFPARLFSFYPTQLDNGDKVLFKNQLEDIFSVDGLFQPKAIILRSLPNSRDKLVKQYSGNNPTYVHHEAISMLVEKGVEHLLLDLPSVDREEDGGALLSHKAFWRYPENPRTDCTITELIYVPDDVPDGDYLLNIQIAAFEIDVSPSKPIIYNLSPK